MAHAVTCCTCMAGFGMERGLKLARRHQQNWLMHIDPDEVVLPSTGALSLATGERAQQHTICILLRA